VGITRRDFLKLTGATATATTLGLPPLLASAQQAGPESGILWPQGQALPAFAAPRHLDVADLTQVQGDVQALVTTLQGVVNRTRPRIYVLMAGDGSDQTWLDTIGVPHTAVSDPFALVARYREDVRGVIVYDPDQSDSVNVATTLAGLEGAVVASPDLAAKLVAAPYGLKVLDDLRGRFTSTLDAYRWQLQNLWPRCTHRALTGLAGTQSVAVPGVKWTTLARETTQIRDGSNRKVYTIDISSLLGGEGVYIRFQDAFPDDGWGPSVNHVTVTANGTPIADFQPTTAAEQPFLFDADGSSIASGGWRFADGGSSFVYRFAPPAGTTSLVLQVEMWNQFLVTGATTRPTEQLPFPNFRDFVVATRSMVFWLDPLVAEEKALFGQILSKVAPNTPYLGWFVGGHESHGVTLCAQHGVEVVAADFFQNATVFGGVRAPIRSEAPRARTSKPANKVYVTLTLSEGDNAQYDEHKMRQLWDDPGRGKVPLNWSVSPLLLDLAPSMLSHYQRTATDNDLLVAGPSGAGYTYPGQWPGTMVDEFTRLTGRYMRRTGMNLIYALNRIDDTDIPMTDAVARSFVEHVDPLGILYNWESTSEATVGAGTLPIVTQIGIGSVADGRQALAAAVKGWDGTKPLFVALGVLAWSLGPTDMVALASSLGSQFQVVRGDVFFRLLRASLGLR
jgi:GxGYxYP putative glycoside hydrolase C-terminal domain/GxGYxY sequence motif in domain of unknown function N-terminal/TAT (twin-arginine translocation) pathway signal sequence